MLLPFLQIYFCISFIFVSEIIKFWVNLMDFKNTIDSHLHWIRQKNILITAEYPSIYLHVNEWQLHPLFLKLLYQRSGLTMVQWLGINDQLLRKRMLFPHHALPTHRLFKQEWCQTMKWWKGWKWQWAIMDFISLCSLSEFCPVLGWANSMIRANAHVDVRINGTVHT